MLDYRMEDRGELSRYEYLYRRIREDIENGRIAAGDRLPSKRVLATRLGVSVVTVEGAYTQLVAEGYIYARPRSGYFASELPHLAGRADVVGGEGAHRRSDAKALSVSEPLPVPAAAARPAVRSAADRPATVADFTSSADAPDARAAAARIWARSLRAVLTSEPEEEAFAPAPAAGLPRLQEAIAAHLRRTRGMEVDPGCIVIGAGAQLLDTLLVQLLGRDVVFAVEDPGYIRLTRLYQANGVRVRHIPLDAEGPRADALADRAVGVLHLMPSHQFPTGRVTSISRRYELLGWAWGASDRYLIEDDYDCEFRLAGRPVPALASIDAGGRVIYTNTFSKSLSGALRLAYMVLPRPLMDRFHAELGFYSSTVSSVEQMALANMLETGAYERHVARIRKRCRDVRDALEEAVASGEGMRLEEADSGLHAVLAVTSSHGEEEIARRAAQAGVLVEPLSRHAWCPENRTGADGLRRFVLRYGSVDVASVPAAVDVLRAAARK